ncbi:MAG: tyrosine-type recombinase/integrase [Holosporales bacterium]|jgi:integrase|nr:tyrosine-type recombinase/integrase [Holosporales bacterium]
MQEKLTQTIVQRIASTGQRQKIKDLVLPGLMLRVEPSGKKTWYIDYKRPNGQRTYHKIGSAEILTVMQARDVAQKFLASVKLGNDPVKAEEVKKERLTLKQLIFEHYSSWVTDNRRSGKETMAILTHSFKDFMDMPVEEISMLTLEQWRTRRRQTEGLKASSLNRQITALKAAINWAVKHEIIEANPLARLEKLREEDSETKVRYLSPEERKRLLAALDAREDRIRAGRDSHNDWLDGREKSLLPDLKASTFVDYLKPMVIVALNSGIRRGSLFRLEWSDIDFQEGTLTVQPSSEKNSKLIHIPMNQTLMTTLAAWKEQTGGERLVFPSPKTGEVMNNCKRAWAGVLKNAEIKNFRWHDMRHDFASQLVIKGVDLNTVRDLLGHADMTMTLRYAHLAPKVKRAAVNLLDQ